MYQVTKQFSFDAAHRLFMMPDGHKCRNLHGHTYTVDVTIQSDTLNEYGFVIDFGELKPIKDWLDEHFDHATIVAHNDKDLQKVCVELKTKFFVLPPHYEQSSSENLADFLVKVATDLISYNFSGRTDNISTASISVTVSETPTSHATKF